jgi:GR25 family glycosyltransferase involved in LPS biosynthesis
LHVHFINLDRSKDRLAEFQSVNSHLAQITRVAAFEEHRVDLDALTRQGLVTSDILTTYPIGALCHVMSDILLWNKAIESAEQITVADDDTIFNLNFDVEAAELVKTLPPDWDLIIWAYNFDAFLAFDLLPGVSPCVVHFNQDKMRLIPEPFNRHLYLRVRTDCYGRLVATVTRFRRKVPKILRESAFLCDPRSFLGQRASADPVTQ